MAAAYGERADALSAQFIVLLDNTVKKHRAIEQDDHLTPVGRDAARKDLAAAAHAKLSEMMRPVIGDLDSRLAAAQKVAGATRALNWNDLTADRTMRVNERAEPETVAAIPDTGARGTDLALRLDLVRREILDLLKTNALEVGALLRHAAETCDGLTMVAIDQLPSFLAARIERDAGVKLSQLRQRFLEQLDPQRFALVAVWGSAGRLVVANYAAARVALRQALGVVVASPAYEPADLRASINRFTIGAAPDELTLGAPSPLAAATAR